MKLPSICLAGALSVLSGCATVGDALDAINPFSTPIPKVQPAPLPTDAPKAELARLWQGAIGAGGEFVFAPAVVGERVFVAARDGALARFDQGRQVWRIQAGQTISGGVGASDKLVVVGTPKGEVLAFDAADGRAVWQARASSEILAAPALRGDLVAVRSGDARIFGFAAADGKRRWVYQRSTPTLALRSTVGVTLTERALYAGFPGGKLVAVALNNGAALWESSVATPRGTTELERIADVASEPVADGGMVCAVAYQGRIACFDADNGRQLWARDLSSAVGLDIGGRAIYATDTKSAVHAFDRSSGATLWKHEKLLNRRLTRPLALGSSSGASVAVADFEGYVHVLAGEDGAYAARQATDGSAILAAPRLLAAGNALAVQTRNGAVVALQIK